MIESPVIAELLAKNTAETRAETLLRVLRKRFREVPEDLTTSLRPCTDGDRLDRWLDVALDAVSLEQFRQQTEL